MAQTYTPEQVRAAVGEAVTRVRELREAALATLPARSRGRAAIVAACDEALAATGQAVQGMSVGDEPGVLRATWERALGAARRAYERAEQTVGEVARATRERLARLWDVTAQVAEAVKQTVREQLARAVEAAKTAVQAAALVLGGLLAASAAVMFSGWVILAAFGLWYLSGKKGD
jgi:hypothetical protein